MAEARETLRLVMNAGAAGVMQSLRQTLNALPEEHQTYDMALRIIKRVEDMLTKEMHEEKRDSGQS